MKIKFNLKAGLSLTKKETKEYLKVAGDVATKLFSTKSAEHKFSSTFSAIEGMWSYPSSNPGIAGDINPYAQTEKKKTGVKPVSSSCIKTYADLDLKKIADESVKEAIVKKHVFNAINPDDEQYVKNQAIKLFRERTGFNYEIAHREIEAAYRRSKTFSYDDRSAEEIKRDAQSYCLKKEHHLPGITEAEARYCSVWEIWRRHKNERWLNSNRHDKKVSLSSLLVSKCVEYIPISTLEMWDYRSARWFDYDFHKRLVITSMIDATSIKFAEAIVAAFRDVDRMSIENERISKLNK